MLHILVIRDDVHIFTWHTSIEITQSTAETRFSLAEIPFRDGLNLYFQSVKYLYLEKHPTI